jgi:L-iditol 2-dehydrogenase
VRALLARGPGDYQVSELAEPRCPPGGLLVEVEAAGVCAADRMLWTGDHPWGEIEWPIVPGHELLGRVLVSDRDDVAACARVTAEVKVPCDHCRWCRAGRDNLCPNGAHLGSSCPGAFAERVALPAGARVHAVPDTLPLGTAVLAEPMACALHAVRRGSVAARDSVAVVGLGAVGALAVIAASSCGARVSAVVRSPAKADLARALDATPLLLGDHAWLDAGAPDVVIECSGTAGGVGTALELVAPGGRVVLYGVQRGPITVDVNAIAEFKELDVRGGHLAPGAFPHAIELLSDPRARQVTTDVRPLEDFRAALEPAAHPAGRPRLKAVLVP